MISLEFKERGHTIFIGNCFGAINPAFGFGQFTSILTGIYGALHIAGKGDYRKMAKPLYNSYENSLVIRGVKELMENDQYDSLVKHCNKPIVSKLCGDDIRADIFKWGSYLLRPINLYSKIIKKPRG